MMNQRQIKVSVIVPIHNAGANLVRCLDTIVNQTLQDIEVILITDCPTDGSDIVARDYARCDERVVLIENSTNLHIGHSRNRAIEIAQGEYLHFSDHDDFRELDMLEQMYDVAHTEGLDMLFSNPVAIINGQHHCYNSLKTIRSRDEILGHLLRGGDEDAKHPWSYYVNIHNVLYKRSLIADNNIRFVDTRELTPEDYIFNVECLVHSQRVSEIKKDFYYHVLWGGSAGLNYNYFAGPERSKGFIHINNILSATRLLPRYKADFYHNLAKNHIFLLFRAIEIKHSLCEFFKLISFYRTNQCIVEAFYLYQTRVNLEYTGWKRCVIKSIIRAVIFANKELKS